MDRFFNQAKRSFIDSRSDALEVVAIASGKTQAWMLFRNHYAEQGKAPPAFDDLTEVPFDPIGFEALK